MEENLEKVAIIKEKNFIIISDKKIEYKLNFFISNNNLFCINVFTTNNFQNKKYSLSLTMNDLVKYRFFKIFVDLDEIFRELENKIEKSIIIEDTNLIYLDIPIGLIVINDIILEIKEVEKSKDEIIKELNDQLNKKDKIINENNIKIKELENKLKEREINKFKYKKQILNQTIEKNKEELEFKNLIIESYENYENIIEIEIETNENNKEIKIINNNLFSEENTNLIINQNKTKFNNIIKFNNKGIYKLLILNNNKLENLEDLFINCKEIKKIKFIKFNTQNVQILNYMLSDYNSLISNNKSKDVNTQNVRSIKNNFSFCSSLTSIDLSNFNTQNIQYKDGMFFDYKSLTLIDVSKFNTQNVNDMNYSESFTSIDVSKFNTQNA